MQTTPEIEDVSEYFERNYPNARVVAAERKGANVLVLFDHGPKQDGARLAGDHQPRRWEVSYRWLRHPTADLCQVLGSEITWWKARELNPAKGLFDQLNCF